MKWAVIGTWKMAQLGCAETERLLKEHVPASTAIVEGIKLVENEPSFHSVGYGGLPNRDGIVQCDSGYMDGNTLRFGAVGCLTNYKNPILVAQSLCPRDVNNFLVGKGADEYAEANGFEKCNMLTEEAKDRYEERKNELEKLSAYKGHDTVCFIVKDETNHMIAATSTSGLFMKENGRVGDSPVPGSGYYVDSTIGGAAATGLGEEIMKGALSYEITRLMEEGTPVQEAAQKAVNKLTKRLIASKGSCDSISVIAMDKDGNPGIGTNIKFPFCYASDTHPCKLYTAVPNGDELIIRDYIPEEDDKKNK